MTHASIARAPSRRLPRCAGSVVVGAFVLLAAPGVSAQQFGSVGSSVTVDYGVLDSLGGGANLPGMLSSGDHPPAVGGAAPGSVWPPQGGLPYAGNSHGDGLLPAPPTPPRSTLTAGQPVAQALRQPDAGVVTLIPPSQAKSAAPAVAPSPAPAPAPAPAAAPTAPIVQAVADEAPSVPTPPPPPTPVAEPPPLPAPTEVAQPSPSAVPMPEAPVVQASGFESRPDDSMMEDAAGDGGGQIVAADAEASAAASTPPMEADTETAAAAQPPESTDTPSDEAVAEPGNEIAEGGVAEADSATPTDGGATQEAALPAPATVEGQISVAFDEGGSELGPEAMSRLDTVADRLLEDDSLRVQLLAYAQAVDDNTSRARRMSLSRALAVRAYLIEKGVRSTRMDVRALGANVEGEPADRVDIIPQAQ